MISSKFILSILDLLLDGDEAGKALRPQIEFLVDADYDYTGVGLFVYFDTTAGIENHRYQKDEIILDGVTMTSSELSIGACATLFVKDGFVKTLNIWSYGGEYPYKELGNYILTQEGDFGTNREIRSSGHEI